MATETPGKRTAGVTALGVWDGVALTEGGRYSEDSSYLVCLFLEQSWKSVRQSKQNSLLLPTSLLFLGGGYGITCNKLFSKVVK